MFSGIKLVRMPHKGCMKNNYSFTQNGWNYKPNPNSLPDISWWPLNFHFSSVTSLLRHCHLQWVCSFSSSLLHSTRFIQRWSLCDLHVDLAILAQLFNFLYFAIFLRDHYDIAFNATSIFDRSKLSLIVQWETIWLTSLPERRNQGGEFLTILISKLCCNIIESIEKMKYDHTYSKSPIVFTMST